MLRLSTLLILFSLLVSCSKKTTDALNLDKVPNVFLEKYEITDAYLEELQDWQQKRIDNLKSPLGWLSLDGLYWLKQGENTIGTEASNDIVLRDIGLRQAGTFMIDGDKVKFQPKGEAFINSEQKAQADGTILHDQQGSPTVLNEQSYHMHVIKRGDKLGLRVKNTLADTRFSFQGIPTYEVTNDYIKYGELVATPGQDIMVVQNIVGTDVEYKLAGKLRFIHEGQWRYLMAFEGGVDQLFIILKDTTSGEYTYGGGRFLSVRKSEKYPDYYLIDFNRAYNPPCALTNYSTCPLPPQENHLPFAVNAGEKLPKFK